MAHVDRKGGEGKWALNLPFPSFPIQVLIHFLHHLLHKLAASFVCSKQLETEYILMKFNTDGIY
jgi:hypothetical protein